MEQKEIKGQSAALELNAQARLGEGAIWHPVEEVLYWVDIEGCALHIYDPETGQDRKMDVGQRIGTVVPVEQGNALVALQDGIYQINTQTGELTFITDPIREKDIRFNDGKCDPAGRFWVGTMALDTRQGAAKLFRMNLDGSIDEVLQNLTIANGIVWTADKRTMYFTDTPTQQIKAFDYDNETGDISNERTIVNVPKDEGSPDGMTIDSEDKIWVALHGGGAVAQYDPANGQLLQKIKVPAPNTTSCAFGGKQLDTLFITSGRDGLSDEKLQEFPHSGAVFSVKPGSRGMPAGFYRGKLQV